MVVSLPIALAATTEWRRLTITLAWLSPVNSRSRIYRMARLAFQPPTDELGVSRKQADHNAARKGTVQHEVLEGDQAVAYVAGDSLEIAVDCIVDAGRLTAPIRYAIAATIEVGATVQVDLHAQVSQALAVRAQQARVRPRS
jgi:hypothetical protein